MNVLLLSLFTIVVVLAFMEDYMLSWQKILVLVTLGIAMICIATFKPMTTADAGTYEYYFYFNDDDIIELATEPTYIHLSRLVLSMGGEVIVMFFIYAALAIPLKLAALWKCTPYIFTAMIVYIGIYYPMHDVVQIRCGVATAFLLWALVPLAQKQYLKATGLMLVATSFHYSSLAFLPVLLIGNIPVGKYWKYALGATIPICLTLYFLNFDALSLLPSSVIEGKMDLYKEMSDTGNWDMYVPYKQLTFLSEFILLYVFLFFYDTIEKYCIYAPILVKILVIEMVFITLFTEIPVLGGRLHDLFGMFNAVAFTCCLYCIKPRYVARIGITVFSLGYYLIQMFDEMYFK
jgi:hypothetical protein